MWVYVLAIGAALLFAAGSVIQQRVAYEAPPEKTLSPALLLWLVRRPLWLLGIFASFVGNLLAAAALGMGGVALVQPLLNVRLIFALAILALVLKTPLTRRDWFGAVLTGFGLGLFVAVGRPVPGEPLEVATLDWILALTSLVGIVAILFVAGRRLDPARQATLLAAGAGLLFAMQSSLTEVAVNVLGEGGVLSLLTHWQPYVLIAAALTGAVLIQSAYEMAPLTASYPALATTEPLAGIAIGVLVLGGSLQTGLVEIGAEAVGLAAMTAGVYLLATSPLITGQLDALRRRREEGEAFRTMAEVEEDLEELHRDLVAFQEDPGRRDDIEEHLRCAEREMARLRELQVKMRRHREADKQQLELLSDREREQLQPLEDELDQREEELDRSAERLDERLAQLREQSRAITGR